VWKRKANRFRLSNREAKILVAMAEIVFQVVAFGLEHIVVFVFDLPPAASVAHKGFDGGLRDGKVGDPGVFVELFPRIFPGVMVSSHQLTASAAWSPRKGSWFA
jgi:hypothetical protein